MFNESDPELTRLFADARGPLAPEPFVANLLSRVERARQARLWRQMLGVTAAMILLALNAPAILETTVRAARFAGESSPSLAEVLITPWGWAGSAVIGIWVVLRTRPSRR